MSKIEEEFQKNGEIAKVLSAQLPYLTKYQGAIFVVKYGGNAMTDAALQQAFAEDVVLLSKLGIQVVVVHGGGPQIELGLSKIGKKGEFIQGLRVTDEETMQVVQWVLLGQVQQEVVDLIQKAGGRAVGLSGFDDGLIRAKKKLLKDDVDPSRLIDIGSVGSVEAINPDVIYALLGAGFTPVISPIASNELGQKFNVNADSVAAAVAKKVEAEKLFMLTNITGVMNQKGELLRELNADDVHALMLDGTIYGGMIPKIQGALDAVKEGVEYVHIADGRVAHVLLLEILAGMACGTVIRGK